MRKGKPRATHKEGVAQLRKTKLHTESANGSTHWSMLTVAAGTVTSEISVRNGYQRLGRRPHRTQDFILHGGPPFTEKLRAVVDS